MIHVAHVPDPGHGEVRRQLGDLHHLRSIGEFFKNPQSQRELLFGVSVGFTLLELQKYRGTVQARDQVHGELRGGTQAHDETEGQGH